MTDIYVQELTGSKNIKLKPQIDESLIAGFIVKYGSSEIDLSVKGQLNKISNELVNTKAASLEVQIQPCRHAAHGWRRLLLLLQDTWPNATCC